MFVPNTDNSNKFGKTYLQKQSPSPKKSRVNPKMMKSESPVPGESKTQTNSNANLNSISDIAPTTGGYNISMVIAANTS